MSISSFHTQVATKNSSGHMNRITKVTYLISPDTKDNEYKKFDIDIEDFKSTAQIIYKEKVGQKMRQNHKANLIKEAVINIKENTNVKDIENLFIKLKEAFTGHNIFEIAIHKDEGYFYHTLEKLEYRPNADIFYNEIDKNFYLDKDFKEKANLDLFEKRFNYHAHVIYSDFNMDSGKTARMGRSDFRKRQTIVADVLGMQRGEEFSKAKRMNHWQLKQEADIKRKLKLDLTKENSKVLAKQKDLKKEIADLRSELKENKATRPDYAKLEQLNRDLKELVKSKDLTIDELNGYVKRLKVNLDFEKSKHELKEIEKEDISKNLIEARETIFNQKEEISILKEDKSVLKQSMNDYESKNNFYKMDYMNLKEKLEEKTKTIDYQNKLLDEKDLKLNELKEIDRSKRLLVKEKIPTKRVTIKDGLFKSKEIMIYDYRAVETFVNVSKEKEFEDKKYIDKLESGYRDLNTLVKDKQNNKINIDKIVYEVKKVYELNRWFTDRFKEINKYLEKPMGKFKDVFDGLKEKFLDNQKEVKELSPLEQAKLDLKNSKDENIREKGEEALENMKKEYAESLKNSNLEKDVKELRELIKPKPRRRSRSIDRDFER